MATTPPPDTTHWLICTACGTQFPTADRQQQTTCFICDDPRQFTPPTGQSFTTLGALTSSPAGYHNVFSTYGQDDRITFIYTTPKVGIGQRCALVKTPVGNVLWDCITLLDPPTIDRIQKLGGLRAIVISHPHYYSTHLLWAQIFDCKVYMAEEDREWLAQTDEERQVLITPACTSVPITIPEVAPATAETRQVDSGARVLKLGGHFPGSLVLLFDGRLFVADTLVTTPAGLGSWGADAVGKPREGHLGRPGGMNTFAFMWSIPNMIPLSPEEISRMWKVLSPHEFRSTHGAFMGHDIEDAAIKTRVLDSMKTQVSRMGWSDHLFMSTTT